MSFSSPKEKQASKLKEDFEIDVELEAARSGAKIHWYPKGYGRITLPIPAMEELVKAGVVKEKHRLKLKVITNDRQREALDNIGRFDQFPYVVAWVLPAEGEKWK